MSVLIFVIGDSLQIYNVWAVFAGMMVDNQIKLLWDGIYGIHGIPYR